MSQAITDDPQARELLRDAHEHTYRWPTDLRGFTARVIYTGPEGDAMGTVRITLPSGAPITVEVNNADAQKWIAGELAMIVGHRAGGRGFDEGDGKNTLTFGADDTHPAGRLVHLNDRFQSSYRVRDHHMWQVNRTMPGAKFTIDVTDVQQVDNSNLTYAYTVTWFDHESGGVRSTDTYTDTFQEYDGALLPKSHTIISQPTGGSTIETRSMTLSDYAVL